MTNPSPRPALRKAEDAEVHPAAPRPVRSPRARKTAASPGPVTSVPGPAAPAAALADPSPAAAAALDPLMTPPAKAPGKRKRAFSGSTSDHMRMPEAETPPEPAHAPRSKAAKKPAAVAAPEPPRAAEVPADATTAATAGAKARADERLMGGKTVTVELRLPKKLRKAASAEAKARGLDVDAVVADLLYAWVTKR